jgi:diguanylate cyclase (GGDEF)-like protein
MQASSLASRIKRGTGIEDWACWRLPPLLRGYVVAVIALGVIVIGAGAWLTDWHVADVLKFLLLACCGTISMASTPRVVYRVGGATRDFSSMWAVPTAILLPPVYSMLISIPIVATLFLFVHRGQLYRRVFSAAALGLSYVAVSAVFRAFPHSFAGPTVGTGLHAFTWCLAVGACEILGCRIQHFLIVGAVKLSNPSMRFFAGEFDRDALQELFVEIDLSILITVAVALSPLLVAIALPTVLLVRRFLVHPVLVAQSRVDAKTGLLNVSTWEAEAEAELSRSVRTRNPVALALVDIDHFKTVNDTHGHLVGDRVLKSIAEALTSRSRDYDRVGRFGGEEFVLLLAQTSQDDACKIAERLRGYVASLVIPTDDRPDAPTLTVTISIGVTGMARGESFELTDLLAASDSAMYAAKQAGRNQVAFAPPLRDMGLDAAWNSTADAASAGDRTGDDAPRAEGSPLSGHRVVLVQTEQTAASLCPRR